MRLGISLRKLEEVCGVSRGMLALMESGRLIPSGDEYDAVMRALDKYRTVA